MAKVAITGGSGFIGSNLVEKLSRQGHEVIVVDDLSTGLQINLSNLKCKFYQFSILNFDQLKKTISDCSVIFHLAARGSVPRSIKFPRQTQEINSTGTLNILEVARQSYAHVIFSSSSSVYGRNSEIPKHEKMWISPISPYAASKISAEALIQSYASSFNIPTTIFRFFNVFGPKQRFDHEYAAVIPKWINLAMNDLPIEVYGDLNISRDFTFVDTVVDVLEQTLNLGIVSDEPINLGFGKQITLQRIIENLQMSFPNLNVVMKNPRKGDLLQSQNNPKKFLENFPNIFVEEFENSFHKTLNWYKDQLIDNQ
jgi:UDP-glucose 4-epimerase